MPFCGYGDGQLDSDEENMSRKKLETSYTARTAAEHRRFTYIRQVAPYVSHLMYGSSGPHESTPPQRHLDWLSRFCRARVCDQHRNRPHYVKTSTAIASI